MSSKKDAKIAGLIMAAGGSSRLDSPKQLLNWGSGSLINHTIDVVQTAGIDPVYVILGSRFEQISKEIHAGSHPAEIHILFNPRWQEGMSTSIKCGINALGEDIEGTFIFLSDQPFISPDLIREIYTIFMAAGAEIVAPRVNGQQCNPVLFRRSFFPQLMTVSGDRGAKKMIAGADVTWLDWPDERLLLDIDSEADYRKALSQSAY